MMEVADSNLKQHMVYTNMIKLLDFDLPQYATHARCDSMELHWHHHFSIFLDRKGQKMIKCNIHDYESDLEQTWKVSNQYK